MNRLYLDIYSARTRLTILDITLITPPASLAPLEAALSQNPHLTGLPAPSPIVLAPAGLEMTMGTAELLRLPEVQACINSDFLLLPCDLICDIPGESLLEAWMVSQSALGGSIAESRNTHGLMTGPGGEQGGRRGGLSLFYQTQGREESVKNEPTDFVAYAPLGQDEAPAAHPLEGPAALRFRLSKLALSMPMDTLKQKIEEDKGFLVRHSLVKKHAQVKMLTTYRDAHIYVFPYWVKELARLNEKFQSVSEDLVGWWAKSEWQTGLGEKLKMNEIFQRESHSENGSNDGESLEQEIDLEAMCTTKSGAFNQSVQNGSGFLYASRVKAPDSKPTKTLKSTTVPPLLAYIHSSLASSPLIRRVDSTATLLSTSLRLAKLESIEEVGRAASQFAHNQKIAHPAGVAQRCTVTKNDCLLAENVTVEEKCVVKESVIGANCEIRSGARLTRCVIMDGAVIGERCQLTNTVVGRRSKIERECVLKDCEVQDGNVIPEETDAKNEKFMVFEGLEEEGGMDVAGEFDENQDDLGF